MFVHDSGQFMVVLFTLSLRVAYWSRNKRGCQQITLKSDLGRFRIRSRNQRTNLNPNPDLIPDSDSCVVESDLESESCRFESESDSDS